MKIIKKEKGITREVYLGFNNKEFTKTRTRFGLISREQHNLEDGYYVAEETRRIKDKRGKLVPIYKLERKLSTRKNEKDKDIEYFQPSRTLFVSRIISYNEYLEVLHNKLILHSSCKKENQDLFKIKFIDLDLNYKLAEKFIEISGEEIDKLVKKYIQENKEKARKIVEEDLYIDLVKLEKIEFPKLEVIINGEKVSSERIQDVKDFLEKGDFNITRLSLEDIVCSDLVWNLESDDKLVFKTKKEILGIDCYSEGLVGVGYTTRYNGQEIEEQKMLEILVRMLGFNLNKYEIIRTRKEY